MASILEQIPGYGGYIAKRQANEQQSLADLMSALKVQDMLMQQKQMDRADRMAKLEELKFQRDSEEFARQQARLTAGAEAVKQFSPRAQAVYRMTGDALKALEVDNQDRFMESIPGLLGGGQVAAPRPLQGRVSGAFQINNPADAERLVADYTRLKQTNPVEAAGVEEALVQQGIIPAPTQRVAASPEAIGQAGVMGALSGVKGADKLIEYAKLTQPSIGSIDAGGTIYRQDSKTGRMVGEPIAKTMTPDQVASNRRDDARASFEFGYGGGAPGVAGAPNSGTASGGLAPKAQQDIVAAGIKEFGQNWIKNTYQPVQEKAQNADQIITQVQTLRNIDLKTGWGTETAAAAANILAALGGFAPEVAKKLATNAQVFQQVANERLWVTLNDAKGPQTEGDAERAKATWAQLKNTPQANAFILDMMQAKARRDKLKAEFYNDAYPLAAQDGNYARIDKEWRKVQRSIWDDPEMQKWKARK